MGCWHKTCGLSNLHIHPSDDVYVFVLEAMGRHERCYSTAFWRPLPLPFYSKYNDYGGGEESSGIALPFILNGVRDNLIEVEIGDNKYHDIAVKKDDFNEELFFEAVHEGRLSVRNYLGGSEVDFVMFRKDIVDGILANWRRQDYVGDGKGTTGWDNNYIEYGFSDILADIPEFIERFANDLADASGHRFMRGLDQLFKHGDPNLVGKWIRSSEGYHFSSVVHITEVLTEMVEANQLDNAKELLTDHLKAHYINAFMEATRKNWAPGGHEGSQSQEHHGYRVLVNEINKALDAERKEYADENGEDEFSEF